MTDVTSTAPAKAKLDGREKFAVEMGPIAVFLIGFFLHSRLGPVADRIVGTEFFGMEGHELYLALAMMLPVLIIALGYSLIKTRRIAPMLLVSSMIMIVLGALTFIFQSKTFFYIKPTIIYGFFAALLAGGLLSGRTFLKSAFDGAFDMPEAAWRTLSWRFIGFLVVAAVMNEIFWRTLTAGCVPDAFCDGEGTWVKIKSFGYPIASFAFIAANMPFIMKHTAAEEEGDKA